MLNSRVFHITVLKYPAPTFRSSTVRFKSTTVSVQHFHVNDKKHINCNLTYDVFTPKSVDSQTEKKYPPIFFLHGLLGNRKNNKTASKRLAQLLNTTIVTPDLRNHGDSAHESPLDYNSMTEDIHNLYYELCQLDIIKKESTTNKHATAIIMGHSMGGKVALLSSLRYPNIFKGTISIDNIPYDSPEESYKEFEKFHIYIKNLKKITSDTTITTMDQVDEKLSLIESDPLVRKFIMSNLVRDYKLLEKSKAKEIEKFDSPVIKSKIPLDIVENGIENIIGFDLSDKIDISKLKKYSHPVLIIRANKSPFIGENVKEELIEKHYEDYELVSFDCGHWIVSEKPKEFIETVVNWISKKF